MIGKLSIVLAAVLLLLSLSGITIAALKVNALRDQVTVTTAHIAGDPAMLDGLSLRLRNTYYHLLFWDTAHMPAAGQTETVFDFSAIRRGEYSPTTYRGVELDNGLHFGYSMSGSGYSDDDFNGEEERGLIAAYNKLYRETPNGEKRTMTVDLADYYDYYPITGTISLPEFTLSMHWEDAHLSYTPTKESRLYVAHRLNEYFKIPMLPHQMLEISIQKSVNGLSVSVGSSGSPVDKADEYPRYEMTSNSVVTDQACYFTINAQNTHGEPMDVSQIEGGYGIYRLPCAGKMTDIDALQNVYPLDPADGAILELDLSADERELLLYRKYGETYTLTVIDLSDMSTQQILSLGQNPGGFDSFGFHDGGDYHLIALGYARMLLIERDDRGNYRISLDLPVDEASLGLGEKDTGHLRYFYPTMVSAWDGERLALADNLGYHGGYEKYNQACDFYLAVFTADGLQYYGLCETSLNADTDPRNTNAACWPMDNEPLTLVWQGKQ
ncbi:MAG: hypothetical protein IJC15_02090 [Clostridia bacterium]|nr:hypothetical protein [Clostridia bacterium]